MPNPLRDVLSRFSFTCVLIAGWVSLHSFAVAENWTRFRGPNGTGIDETQGIPTTWTSEDLAWNVELPGVGHSSPVIWEEKLFITSAVQPDGEDGGAERYLICLNALSGEQLWMKLVGFNPSHRHNKNSYASSTPAVDSDRVYVAFADQEKYTLAAYSHDGTLLWRRNLGSFTSQHGQGVSPIVFNDMVILPNDQMGPSSIMAFNCETGETVWSTMRTFRRTSYSTPMIVDPIGQRPQLICVCGALGMSSLDPFTGQLYWETGEVPQRTVASPILSGGLLIASCGGGGVGSLMIAVNPDLDLDPSRKRIEWQKEKILPYVPTPIAYGGHLYLWNDNGVVSCVETQTGEAIWTKRVGGNFSGSPICVNGILYCMSESGECCMVEASPEGKLIGKVSLGDPSHSTPAVANNRLYLRTFHRLMCIEAGQ